MCVKEREKKERSSGLCRWILIKYWWSAVLKAWLGSDWAEPQQEHRLTSDTHTYTQVEVLAPESEQVFIMPPAGQLVTFFTSLFILTFLHPPFTSSCHTEITHRQQHVHFQLWTFILLLHFVLNDILLLQWFCKNTNRNHIKVIVIHLFQAWKLLWNENLSPLKTVVTT